MRHLVSGRKLGVSAPHRKAMLRSLTLALIEREKIVTTPAKAKELRKMADRVITLAKRGDLGARRHLVRLLGSTRTQKVGTNRIRLALKRVYSDLVPRFKTRNGGYTRMVRAGRRAGDNAEICYMQYLPAEEKKTTTKKAKPGAKKAVDTKAGASAKKSGPTDKAAKKGGATKKAAPKSSKSTVEARSTSSESPKKTKGTAGRSGPEDKPTKKKG